MLQKYITFWIVIIITTASNIFAVEEKGISSNYKIFIGYGYFDYYKINNLLKKYHHIDDIKTLINGGLEIGFYYNNIILLNQISFSYDNYEGEDTQNNRQYLSFGGIQDQIRIGYSLMNHKNNELSPFVGLLFQYLSIDTDFNYHLKCIDCFFQYRHEYGNFNIGILYGISYEQRLPFRDNILDHFSVCFNLGGSIPILNEKWWIDGKTIENTQYVPPGNFRYFGNIKLNYQF